MSDTAGHGDADGTDGGTYTLVCRLAAPATIGVGALGERAFAAGPYAYTGSAFGPGGFARVERHRDLAAGDRDARHWHVDYLLGHPDATVERVVTSPGVDIECAVARALADRHDPVPAFGASDCDCDTHLVAGDDGESEGASVEPEPAPVGSLVASVERAHERASTNHLAD